MSSLLSANYAQNFGAQSQILSNLGNIFTPIAEAGPDQQGFGAQQLAALNTQAGQGVGENYAKAAQALGTQLSAQGGGNEDLPTGASAALKAGLATSATNQMSQEQLAITNANYTQGRSNWQNATAGLNALAQDYNPNAIASTAVNANQSAFGQANQVQTQKNQEESAIIGGVTGLLTGGLGFLTGGLSNVMAGGSQAGSETGGGFEQFMSGGLSGLQGPAGQ